jgi:hypothetical protein
MHVEDLIITLATLGKPNQFDFPILDSFYNQLIFGSGFTEKQAALAVRILKRYSVELSSITQADIPSMLVNPTFRLAIRQINNAKQVSIVPHDVYTRVIKVEFPYDQVKIDHIKKNRNSLDYCMWSPEQKAWIFSLTEKNLYFVCDLIEEFSFQVDDDFDNFRNQISNIIENIELHAPMLSLDNGRFKYTNVSRYVPELTSDDNVSALFESRKAGISTWDTSVVEFLNQSDLNQVTKSFLLSSQSEPFDVDSGNQDVNCLSDIVHHMQPCLFIIPGGLEQEKTAEIYNFLKSQGYRDEEMSVLFRLPTSQGKEFNEFVKNNNLNSPITDETKFVFISIKMPKPVVKSGINFQTVVSLGKSNVHYTIREFFKNRQNLIYYCGKTVQKEFRFGKL